MGKLKTDVIQKVYFCQSEVANLLDVNAGMLRSWKKYFFPKLPKGKNRFTRIIPLDYVGKFKALYLLILKERYTLPGADKRLKSMNKEELDMYINKFDNMKK